MGAGRAARRGRVAENEALHPAVPPTQTGAHPSQPVTTRSPLAPAPLSRCPHVGTLPVGWQRGPGTLGLVALPASSIWLSSKRFLLVGRPCRDWHRDCVSCWGRRQDREAGRMCVRDRLPAQPMASASTTTARWSVAVPARRRFSRCLELDGSYSCCWWWGCQGAS